MLLNFLFLSLSLRGLSRFADVQRNDLASPSAQELTPTPNTQLSESERERDQIIITRE